MKQQFGTNDAQHSGKTLPLKKAREIAIFYQTTLQ